MSSTNHPDWLDQVQKYETSNPALQVPAGVDESRDPVVVGAAMSVIADAIESGAAQPAIDGEREAVVIDGRVYVRAGGFKQLADGRNLPVFISEARPEAADQDVAVSVALVQFQSGAVNELLYEAREAVDKGDAEDARRALGLIREAVFSSVDGLARSVLMCLMHLTEAKLDAGSVIKKWIRDHEAELNYTEFARIDASLERLVMHLGLELADKRMPAGGTVYRLLNRGERILATDEYVDDDFRTWVPVGDSIFKGMEFRGMKPIRRAIEVSRAESVPERFLDICREELARGKLTSLPLKGEFAAPRGMTLEEVTDWMLKTRRAFVDAVEGAGKGAAPVSEEAAKLPAIMVVMQDKDFAQRNPDHAFYLRIERDEHKIETVELPGAVTPIHARKIALGLGYEPTHWVQYRGNPCKF
jgi:hypothetical protein